MVYYIDNYTQELSMYYDDNNIYTDINISKEQSFNIERNQYESEEVNDLLHNNMFFVYTHCKYGEIGVTEISKSVEEFKKSYEESKSYLEYFGYTFSIAYIAAIGYLSPYTAAASFTLGSFKDYFNNVKILEKESYEIEFSLFDLLHNTTTSLTFYNIANFTEGKLKPYNNNSGNKIFKTVSLCVKTALDVTNAVFIQKDAYTEIGEKTNEALFKDVNNKKNILKTDFTKTSAKITAKGFLKFINYLEYGDLVNNKALGKIIEKIIIRNNSATSSLTFKEFDELVDQSYIASLKNFMCIKKLKTHVVGSVAIPYCIAGFDYLFSVSR